MTSLLLSTMAACLVVLTGANSIVDMNKVLCKVILYWLDSPTFIVRVGFFFTIALYELRSVPEK